MNTLRFTIFLLKMLASASIFCQQCTLSVEGYVLDKNTDEPLSFVNIIVQENGIVSSTDDLGYFNVSDLCPGHYHLYLSHIGCEPQLIHLDIEQDTSLQFIMDHSPVNIEGIVIRGSTDGPLQQPSSFVGKQIIEDNLDNNLALLLEDQTGVHLLKNGNNIAKPIIHGMYGNRLVILNNGIIQAGQQWGNDHSPEIDPLVANKLTILKGSSALEYSGANFGSTLLVEPKRIGTEPHLHGRLAYAFNTNGRGHSTNLQMQQYTPLIAYRITGTFKMFGDAKTPDYFLRNTGLREYNLAVQLEKVLNQKWIFETYFSSFNTSLGVLRGSHVGTEPDLIKAFERDVPLFTEDNFRYELEAPRQQVSHHLFKGSVKYLFNDYEKLESVFAFQINDRNEFDIRRNERSKIPALSLLQHTFSTDVKYHRTWDEGLKLVLGNQNIFSLTSNVPGSGILPLLPNNSSNSMGVFSTMAYNHQNFIYDVGIRYDFKTQYVASISSGLEKEIIRYDNIYHNLSLSAGAHWKINDQHNLRFISGYTIRNPEVNELYSNGLHQGVSGLEIGNIDLVSEKGSKTSLAYFWKLGPGFSLESQIYHHYIQDYIFIKPTGEIRPSIRGAFPVFSYDQADTRIYGLDLTSQFNLSKSWIAKLSYSSIYGNNLEENIPMIYIPPASFNAHLTYRYKYLFKWYKANIKDIELEVSNRYVFKQERLEDDQDFLAPPDAYNLVGAKISANVLLPNYNFRLFVNVDNALNAQYREYLNRLRYFADEMGRNISIGINFSF